MPAEEYDRHDHRGNYDNAQHHLRRDVHEASTESKLAKLLSTLALLTAALALALSIWALDKAGQAQSTANRATQTVQGVR